MNDGLKAFGGRMKELAEEKGMTVEELSKATKIRKVFIEAMFRGRREELPDEIFVVGYIKAVLDHLRVDPGPWIEEFRALIKPDPIPEQSPGAPSLTPVPEIRTKSHLAMWAFLVLAIVACSGMYLFRISPADIRGKIIGTRADRDDLKKGSAGAESVKESKRETASIALPVPVQSPAQQKPKTPADVEAGTVNVPSTDKKVGRGLEIRAAAPCWIELKGDAGKILMKREVAKGEALVFPGRRFVISVGDSSAVEIYMDGKMIEIEKGRGKVLRDIEVGGGPD